jgi:hypothetical protein
MKAHELRIGIIVDLRYTSLVHPSGIVSIDNELMMYLLHPDNKNNLDKLSGVPLTEEWFEKLLFERDPFLGWKMGFGGLEILPCDNSYVVYTNEEMPISDHIVYVHELQNLFLGLRGKDLLLSL